LPMMTKDAVVEAPDTVCRIRKERKTQ
jgi:hypothetical protein